MTEYVLQPAGFSRREFREWMLRCARHGGGHRHRMGGFGRAGRAGRGDIRAAILALLAEQPMHGYQIMRELSERSGGAWRVSPGSHLPHAVAARGRGARPGRADRWQAVFC